MFFAILMFMAQVFRDPILGLRTAFSKKNGITVFLFSYAALFLGYFSFANLTSAVSYFSYSSLPLFKQIAFFFISFFDVNQLKEWGTLFLVFGVTLAGALFIMLFYMYLSLRKEAMDKMPLATGMGGALALMLAVLGVGCAACGAVFLTALFSFFGIGGLLVYFPYHGVEVGYAGLAILICLSYTLSIRLSNPYTC